MKSLTKMNISTEYPPNYRRIIEVLGTDDSAVYCYGDTIYNPHGREITADIEVHEAVHSKQQGQYPELWCEKYLTDRDFRLSCEVEAYAVQYKFICKMLKGSSLIPWKLKKLADELSSPCYNLNITPVRARLMIKNFTVKHG